MNYSIQNPNFRERKVRLYARAVHAFSAGIKCQHCVITRIIHRPVLAADQAPDHTLASQASYPQSGFPIQTLCEVDHQLLMKRISSSDLFIDVFTLLSSFIITLLYVNVFC